MDNYSQWSGQQNTQDSFDGDTTDQTTSHMMYDQTQWSAQQNAQNNYGNIDPKLIAMGSWPTSEDSKNSDEVAPPAVLSHEIDRDVDINMGTYNPTAPPQVPPAFTTPPTQNHGQWQTVRRSQRGKQPRRSRQQQPMPPTPETSSWSYPSGQDASAYDVTRTLHSNNPYSLLSVGNPQMPPNQGFWTANVANQHGNITPTSSQHQTRYFGSAPSAPSPLDGRGPPPSGYGQPMQDHTIQAADFHGWPQPTVPPAEDIPGWVQGPYSVAANLSNISPTPYHPTPSNRPNEGTASQLSDPSSTLGTFTCCGQQFDTKTNFDKHTRYHDSSKRTKKCSICNKSFLFEKDLKRHMKTHSSERHIQCNYIDCPYRTKGFKRKDHYKRHLKNVHKVEEGT